jgi:hypothetical protein
VQQLVALLSAKHRDRVSRVRAAAVTYLPREADFSEPTPLVGPSAFAKAARFMDEQEIRIALTASGEPYETIYTQPDEEVAALFKRLR